MKKLVKNGKFFPQESDIDSIKDINNHHLNAPLTTNNDSINKKKIEAPIYAGASSIGWSPQYVGTDLINESAWGLGTLLSIKNLYKSESSPRFSDEAPPWILGAIRLRLSKIP